MINVEKEYKCFRCNSEKIIKRGKVFNTKKTLWRQQYACKNCNYKFLSKKQHMADTYEPPKFVYKDKALPVVDWSAYNSAQLNEKQLFLQLLNNVLEMFEFQPLQRTGRPTTNIRDILYCMVMKNYIKNSSRRTISDLKLLKELNCIETIPCFTTLMKYFNDSRLTDILKKIVETSGLPLREVEEHFSVDASGFSTSVFGRWFDYKWNTEKEKKIYRKCHLTVGTKTNIVTSVLITDQQGVGSSDTVNYLPLIQKTAINFKMKEVSADMAYLSRHNLEETVKLGAIPYIPFKSNVTGGNNGLVWRKMWLYFKEHPQEYFERYHKRSNVETTFSMIKRKFGSNLMTKNYTANVNEILCKIICHNLCCLISAYYELNLEQALCTKAYENQRIVLKA